MAAYSYRRIEVAAEFGAVVFCPTHRPAHLWPRNPDIRHGLWPERRGASAAEPHGLGYLRRVLWSQPSHRPGRAHSPQPVWGVHASKDVGRMTGPYRSRRWPAPARIAATVPSPRSRTRTMDAL